MGGGAGFKFGFGGRGGSSQLHKWVLRNSRNIMTNMVDPVGRLPTGHDLHVGDDIIANAGKRNAVQGRWKYTKVDQRWFSEKVGFLA
jgi:hypothetical protein